MSLVFVVTAEKLANIYYSNAQSGESRSINWFTEGDEVKIYLTIGSVSYYYSTLMVNLMPSIEDLLKKQDRVIGLFDDGGIVVDDKIVVEEPEMLSVKVNDDGTSD